MVFGISIKRFALSSVVCNQKRINESTLHTNDKFNSKSQNYSSRYTNTFIYL
jgi:hypothetical protein